MLNIPYVQRQTSVWVARELSQVLGSRVQIGRINMGLLNRIIVDDLLLDDLRGREMLKVTRLSVKFDVLPLLQGHISISNIQLFGFNVRMERDTPTSEANYQFVLDALSSKDTTHRQKNINLRINSLLMRRGRASYHVQSEPLTPGRFNPHHLKLQNIIVTLSLKALQNDSINAAIKRMSVEESHSGFCLDKLSLKLVGNEQQARVENFAIDLPHTHLKADTLHLRYDSIEAFRDPMHRIHFSARLLPSQVTLADLAPFVPAFASFTDPLMLEVEASGIPNHVECPRLSLRYGRHFRLLGEVSLQELSHPSDAYLFGNLSHLYADPEGVAFFLRNLSGQDKNGGIPPVIQRLGNISFRGEVSGYFTDLVTYGRVQTQLGDIRTDLKLTSDKENGRFSYSGSVKSQDFGLGQLLASNKWGNVTFNLDVDGRHQQGYYPLIMAEGLIASIAYNGYTYHDIALDGEYKQGGFNGRVTLADDNANVTLNGAINIATQVPTFDFMASIDHFRPHALRLTPDKYQNTEFSVKVKANFTGGSIDEMKGEINIDSLQYASPDKSYLIDNLKIAATRTDEQHKRLVLSSNFLRGTIEGDYSYHTLPASIFNILNRYLPTVVPASSKHRETSNNFGFDLHVYDTELLNTVFQVPLKVYTHSTVKGYINDRAGRMRIEGYFPRLRYGNRFIESGMLLCENPGDNFHAQVRLTQRKNSNDAVNIALEARAKNDSIQTALNWGNSNIATYSGKLSAMTHFLRPYAEQAEGQVSTNKPAIKTVVDIHPTDIILNDTLWTISPSQIVLDSGKVYVHDFSFSHKERHLHINGIVSDQPQDTLRMDLQDINIGYVFDIANLGVNFKGEATGPAYACGILHKPVMSTDLFIRNLGLNEGLLGDANIHGEWHHEVKGIYLDAHINENHSTDTHVRGYVYPIKPTSSLDLMIEADSTNLKFIHHYMRGITSHFEGRATGLVHFYGKFKALTMEGKVLGDASMKVDVLNTIFNVKDSIYIAPDGLTFRNNRLIDSRGREGRMNGYLRYRHFKDLRYNFDFSLNNMLVMNTTETPDYPFYGTVYGTGSVAIAGNARDGVDINVAVTTNANTNFTYIKDNVSSATSNQFIRFVDKTPRRTVQDSLILSDYEIAQQEIRREEEESQTDIRLNLLVDATPDATMRIIMDPVAGDYISGRGSGNIRTEFYNKGDVKMFGSYHINQGIYKFSLQEVIRKDFLIRDESSINFNGTPTNASLDIKAYYTVNSASLNDLIPNAADFVNQTNVKVNCLMELSGQLTSPTLQLDLELPNENDEVEALVRNYIPTDEQMNMQILYLLGIGKFYPSENTDNTQSSNVMSSVLSSTLSGQLNNALSQLIENNNWNIGTNLSTGEKGWTDMEFEGMLSGQLLNNRLLINGNFGYRDNPMSNTNFVGDFEAEWLVNRSGDIRLKAYNETNDRYYTKTNLTTQGIGIIFKKDFDKWNELLFWRRWKLKRLEKKNRKQEEAPAESPAEPANSAPVSPAEK